MVTFRYHGNYVGPGWSAGKYQRSVRRSRVPAVDEFDQTAKEHDAAYATPGADLKGADYKFYRRNIGQGLKRSAAAIAVGLQGTLRPPTSFSQNEKQMAKISKKRLTGGATYRAKKQKWVMTRKGQMLPNAAGPFQSPGFDRKQPMKRKSYRTAGASTSKSAGKLKKARGKPDIFDKYARKGIILNLERGANIATTAANPGSVLLAHSTCSRDQLFNAFGYAMSKLVASLLKRDVPTMTGFVLQYPVNFRLEELVIIYKTTPGGANARNVNTVTGTTTWQDLGNFFINLMTTELNNQSGFQFVKIEYFQQQVSTTPPVQPSILFERNLDRCRIHYHTKSNMKIQNRTVNTAGNDESDDVDNVPLYGKQYESSKNYFLHNTIRYVSDINGIYGQIATGELLKPPQLTAVKSAYAIAGVHLDPGQIKTSVLTWTKSFLINDLMRSLFIRGLETGNAYALSVGKSRWFLLEKMLQSVATTDVNGIKVAYEVDTKFAAYVTCPKATVTTQMVSISPA